MSAARHYVVVTAAYWAFTLTDGALRMLVLLHFHRLGYAPVELAFLFLFYELAGVVTNLLGGWIAARMGVRVTLLAGLALQIAALGMLSALDPTWARAASVAFVMAAQALSGVAKDLTKMSSKSAIKTLLPPDAHGPLFRWVALLTGSKNALKGAGFFLGSALLTGLGAFGVVFAINSSVHSYLILAYSDGDKVALNVGFYYMANAGGRLAGTLLSGLVFQAAGLVACLWTAVGFAAVAGAVSLALDDPPHRIALADARAEGAE